MKRYFSFVILSILSLSLTYAQNPENDQIRIKIDANVNGEAVHIDTSINQLSDFDIDAFLEELGIEDELEQLNIDINSGFDFDFNWDQLAIEEMMEGLQNIEMPELPELPEMPELAELSYMGFNKAMLGVYTDKVPEGAKITSIIENSGAEAAGLKEDDIITKIDDRTIESPSNLSEVIGMYEPNTAVKVTYIRNGTTQTVTATLKENEEYMDWENMEWPKIDTMNFKWDKAEWEEMFNAEPHGFLGVYLDDADGKVLINGVEEGSAAEAAGLKEGDILKEINGTSINNYDQVIEIMHATKPGDKVNITYEREGKQMKTEATLKESKTNMFYWNDNEGEEDGYMPNIIIDHIAPCPPGSVYSYNSTDGKKNVNVCITVVTKSDSDTPAPSRNSSTNSNHPLMNPDNLVIYSNPTSGSFNVKFSLPDAGDVKIVITDVNGKEVFEENIDNFSGAYDKTITLGDAAAKGTYFVKVSQDGYSSTKTVVLQ